VLPCPEGLFDPVVHAVDRLALFMKLAQTLPLRGATWRRRRAGHIRLCIVFRNAAANGASQVSSSLPQPDSIASLHKSWLSFNRSFCPSESQKSHFC
jgi:hypothetical protein